MSAAPIIPIDEIRSMTAPWPVRAAELDVHDQETYARGAQLLRDIKALRDEIAKKCDPVIQAAHRAHRAALDQKRELEEELVEADKMIRQKVAAFSAEQERRAREEAARIAAETRAAQERAEAEAKQLEAAGERELADTVRTEAEFHAPARTVEPPKAKGVSTTGYWKAEVTDFRALVAAVAAGTVPLAVLKVDTKVLGQQARSLKNELDWPGVRIYCETGVSVR